MPTDIQWTDETWNCVRGCSRVSSGCGDSTGGGCYAERQAFRFSGPGMPYEGLVRMTPKGPRWTGKVVLVPEKLEEPLRWKKPRRIFVNSMSDLFHESLSNEQIDRVFAVMVRADHHIFQVLTKRPQRMKDYFAADAAWRIWKNLRDDDVGAPGLASDVWGWLKHVWLGVSVEDQKTADERIPLLLQTPAAVRWISAEPLLGPVNLAGTRDPQTRTTKGSYLSWTLCAKDGSTYERPPLDWVVVGGESGPKARPMHPDWARSLRGQCIVADVPFFFKQWGEWKEFGHDDDGPEIHEVECGTDMCEATAPLCDGFLSLDGQFVKKLKEVKPDVHYRGLERVGKKAAGRLLDGVEWNQFPSGVTAKEV